MKEKMPLASLEEMESYETIVSIDGDKEGNITIVQEYFLCFVYTLYKIYIV